MQRWQTVLLREKYLRVETIANKIAIMAQPRNIKKAKMCVIISDESIRVDETDGIILKSRFHKNYYHTLKHTTSLVYASTTLAYKSKIKRRR